MAYELINLEVVEVSLVDYPANQGAKVSFFKNGKPVAKSTIIKQSQQGESMDIKELESKNTELSAKNEGLTQEVTQLKAELSEAKALAGMTDAEKTHCSTLNGDARKNFMGLPQEARKAEIDKAAKAKEEDVLKSLPESVRNRLSKADELEGVVKSQGDTIKSMQDQAEAEKFTKQAATDLPNLKGTAEQKGKLLRSIDKMGAEEKQFALELLKSTDAIVAAALKREQGSQNHNTESNKSYSDFKKRAVEWADKNKKNLTPEQAVDAWMQTEEGKKAYSEHKEK